MMLQGLCCCLVLFSGVAPCAALRPTTDNSLDLSSDGQFSLAQTMKDEPGLTKNLVTNMRTVIEENLLKGLPEPSVQPSSHDPELEGQVTSLLQKLQTSSLEEQFAEQAELAKIPAEQTQVLNEMRSSVKELFNRPQMAATISGQVSNVQKFIGDHPEIDGAIDRYLEHARPSQQAGPQPVPPSLMEEVPELAKKLLPMFKPTVVSMGQSNLSLLQSSTNKSAQIPLPPPFGPFPSVSEIPQLPIPPPYPYTRFEASIKLTFPVACSDSACVKIPVTLLMVKLFPWVKDTFPMPALDGPGFVIIVPGLSVAMPTKSFMFASFIPVPMKEATGGFLPAKKTGFIMSVGWKEANITKMAAGTKGAPAILFSMGCSYLPISVETKKWLSDTWGGRTEPMIELSGGVDTGSGKGNFAVAFKWRTAISYEKHQVFVVLKWPLTTIKGDDKKGPGALKAVAFGLLYHIP